MLTRFKIPPLPRVRTDQKETGRVELLNHRIFGRIRQFMQREALLSSPLLVKIALSSQFHRTVELANVPPQEELRPTRPWTHTQGSPIHKKDASEIS